MKALSTRTFRFFIVTATRVEKSIIGRSKGKKIPSPHAAKEENQIDRKLDFFVLILFKFLCKKKMRRIFFSCYFDKLDRNHAQC